MTELLFIVEEDEEGFHAEAAGASILVEALTWEQLREQVREAVDCHFARPFYSSQASASALI